VEKRGSKILVGERWKRRTGEGEEDRKRGRERMANGRRGVGQWVQREGKERDASSKTRCAKHCMDEYWSLAFLRMF
jgi:hypothetical protein